ncbi:hypothetical protein BKA00_000301 [Actinomadura coerulea]|uniref:Lipoprotein n=1 Tax=Actinomadura coerulea TaxID=46159 RepID=A0A7X0FTG8_9ACTN|nr:hypothetical protein [Actinomadura coerulea]MBB6393387.1 hypothetical protein [Actinomadura coerulea]GGP93253.1 hypothetical protein GCM10010187_06010 [Actinomadura coerulea]
MRALSRTLPAAAALLALAACGSEGGGAGRPCTLIGSEPGLNLVVPDGSRVAAASLRVCWGGTCQEPRIELTPTSKAVSTGCDGDGPDAVCGASASPDGGKSGFARLDGLPKAPVQVTLKLRDAEGRTYFTHRLDVTPKATFPNGPHCGEGPPQAALTVANGQVAVR